MSDERLAEYKAGWKEGSQYWILADREQRRREAWSGPVIASLILSVVALLTASLGHLIARDWGEAASVATPPVVGSEPWVLFYARGRDNVQTATFDATREGEFNRESCHAVAEMLMRQNERAPRYWCERKR